MWISVGWGVVLGAAFIAAGIRLWNRKPAVLAPRTMTAALGVAFLPVLLGAAVLCYAAITEGDARLLLPMLLPVLMLVLLLVFFRQIIGRAVVMNVSENTLYDALEEVLERHGLSYHERRSTIDVDQHDATVDVNYQATTNSGTVNARGTDQTELFPVLEDLREALRGKRLQRRSRLAGWYLGFGVVMVAGQLGLLTLAAANGG